MKPVTILVVPHSRARIVKINFPLAGLCLCFVFMVMGIISFVSMGIRTVNYYEMKSKVSYYSKEFGAIRSSIFSLKQANEELSRLLSFKSKKKILESAAQEDTGSLDIESLRKQIDETIESVSAIKHYMAEQKDLYSATPVGWPVHGAISSGYGLREHPVSGREAFHTGIDIRIPTGTAVKATASGIVSFAGWSSHSGYIVVLEHGHGFSTAYAHNSSLDVAVGQKVKAGEQIALSGSTGVSTGPHLHYEVWKNGKQIDPVSYLKEG